MADGDQPKPTDTVLVARATKITSHREAMSIPPGIDQDLYFSELAYSWRDGGFPWVPDDNPINLTALLKNRHFPIEVSADVETGPRPRTELHTLLGSLERYDATAQTITFSPAVGHEPFSVPLHRVVALTAYRPDHDDNHVAWTAYHEPHRY